jgi:hypothetical protein
MSGRGLCATVCLCAFLSIPQEGAIAGSRGTLPNAMDIELAGKCIIYSFSYQRMINEPFGLEFGVSLLGGGSSNSSSTLLFFTGGGKVYFVQKNASPFIGGGLVVLTASTSTGPFDDSSSSSYGYVGPGFEYRSDGGFLIRGMVNVLFSSGFFVWPGLTVGIAF